MKRCPTCGDVSVVRYENIGQCKDPWHNPDKPLIVPEVLSRITDVVLAYRPKIKTKAAKRRARRNKQALNAKNKPKSRECQLYNSQRKDLTKVRKCARLLTRSEVP
jgi:hypothetical protein